MALAAESAHAFPTTMQRSELYSITSGKLLIRQKIRGLWKSHHLVASLYSTIVESLTTLQSLFSSTSSIIQASSNGGMLRDVTMNATGEVPDANARPYRTGILECKRLSYVDTLFSNRPSSDGSSLPRLSGDYSYNTLIILPYHYSIAIHVHTLSLPPTCAASYPFDMSFHEKKP